MAVAPRSGETTLSSSAIGTPGYMAPELASTPAGAGPRTDIYSLGCTLFFLLTGRPAFEGRTFVEILNKQQTQPIASVHECVKSVPSSLSAIILKMAARRPEDRYADMGDVIRDLEAILGIPSSGAVALGDEQKATLEQNATAWHESPSVKRRCACRITMAILAGCTSGPRARVLAARFPGFMARVFLELGVFTALADFAVAGFRRKTPLFQKVSALVLGSSVSEWLTGIAVAVVFIGLLLITKLFWIWVAILLAAVGIALGLRVLDVHADSERRGPLELIEAIVRSVRQQGYDEDLVRQFVCSASGIHWEELYEALFGYPSLLQARDWWRTIDGGKARPKHAPWRDPLFRWIDARLAVRREANQRAVLQKFEERGLEAQGVNLLTARRKAERAARAMVMTAAEIRETIRPREGTIMVNRSIAEAMREAAVKAESVLLEHERGVLEDRTAPRERTNFLLKLANAVFGPKIRFLSAACGFLFRLYRLDAHQNAMISAEHAQALVEAAKTGDLDAVQSHALSGVAHARERAAMPTRLLELPVLPPAVLAALSSFGSGAGGLFLIVSSFVGGARIAALRLSSLAGGWRSSGLTWGCLPWPASTPAWSQASSARACWPSDCSSPASRVCHCGPFSLSVHAEGYRMPRASHLVEDRGAPQLVVKRPVGLDD